MHGTYRYNSSAMGHQEATHDDMSLRLTFSNTQMRHADDNTPHASDVESITVQPSVHPGALRYFFMITYY